MIANHVLRSIGGESDARRALNLFGWRLWINLGGPSLTLAATSQAMHA
jgi:hypothetical protein